MRSSRVCAVVGAAVSAILLAASIAPAQAADLGYGSIKDVAPAPAPGRTWYLKGTIGMNNADPGGIWIDEPSFATDFTVHHTDIKSTALFGLGIGVEHSRWLRFDITGEYRGKQLFVAQDSYANGGPCGVTGCGTNEYTADLESWLGLANVYIDLLTWHGITPYIGGGVGFSWIDVQGFKDVNVPQGAVYYGNSDKSSTNFAWALYAGLSYDVTPQFTIDLGYRYADLGSVETGRATSATDPSLSYSGVEIEDIVSHDLLFSARYRLDSPRAYPVALK